MDHKFFARLQCPHTWHSRGRPHHVQASAPRHALRRRSKYRQGHDARPCYEQNALSRCSRASGKKHRRALYDSTFERVVGKCWFSLVKAALSDRTQNLEIFVPPARKDDAALSSEPVTKDVGVGKEVDLVHMFAGDDILAVNGLKPDVIRIGTHGHELHVLRGLKKYLRGAPPGAVVVMTQSDPKLMEVSGVEPADVYRLMARELKYSPYCKAQVKVDNAGRLEIDGEQLTKDICSANVEIFSTSSIGSIGGSTHDTEDGGESSTVVQLRVLVVYPSKGTVTVQAKDWCTRRCTVRGVRHND